MSDHRTILLYVPAKLPESILHEFILTHFEGDTGQDAWQHLVTLAAVRENPLTSLIHRLWIEAGGDPTRKIGEVTEGEVLTLLHDLKNTAHHAATKAVEERIVQVTNSIGGPTLVFKDATSKDVTVLLSEVAVHIAREAPFISAVMKRAVQTWQKLKVGGQEPPA